VGEGVLQVDAVAVVLALVVAVPEPEEAAAEAVVCRCWDRAMGSPNDTLECY